VNSSNTTTSGGGEALEAAYLELPYIPDFLLDDVRFYFVPSRDDVRAVYHELVGDSAENWSSYYNKKGWAFIHQDDIHQHDGPDGPYAVEKGCIRLDVAAPGRFFAPTPRFRFTPDGDTYPLVSLEKRRPLNPWKPTYIRAVRFIKKYDWPHGLPLRVQLAVWEIEECGEVAGSTSWINAEAVLMASNSDELRETLADVFYNRPEDFPLGSQVYLRVLGRLGEEGFDKLKGLVAHPVTRKRTVVADTLGELRNPSGVEPLILLLDDEDPNVRVAALRALGKVGLSAGDDAEGKVKAYLESDEVAHRVWAAQASLKLGDPSHRKFLVQLVKEEKRPLADLGDLGDVIVESDLVDAVPFLIQRLKDGRPEISMDAAEVLQKITGLKVEYSAQANDEQKRLAIRTCNRWWEDKKKERRGARG